MKSVTEIADDTRNVIPRWLVYPEDTHVTDEPESDCVFVSDPHKDWIKLSNAARKRWLRENPFC